MKHQWMAYVIVAILSIGAGVAIAGLPDDVPVDPTIIPPTSTEAPAPTLPTTTVPTTTAPATSEAPPATEAPATTDVTASTEPTDTTEPEAPLPERSEVVAAAANGSGSGGAAGRVADQLEGLGYVDVTPLDGTDIVELTVVYYAEGFEDAAVRMAEDLFLLPEFVAPIADAPEVVDLPDGVELVAYVGADRA